MATIELNVQDSPIGGSLSLADTLAKGIFGDPEGQMKARNLASQILAHQAYATKLGADTRLVSEHLTEDQRAEAERLRAGPLIGEAAAAAIPAPIPVEASRANAPGTTGYGPQPGIVSPDEASRVEKLRARERALGPILARSKPEDIGKAVGVDYGGTILAGATANPAIVNPDSLRLASTLYTGSAPTTSTVMTTGDYAGVDAATRGKILEERAKPPPITDYRGQPGNRPLRRPGQPDLHSGARHRAGPDQAQHDGSQRRPSRDHHRPNHRQGGLDARAWGAGQAARDQDHRKRRRALPAYPRRVGT